MLLKLADALDEHAEELAQLESLNVGKPLSYARDEMPVSSDNIRFFAGAARVLEGRSAGEYMRGYTSMIRREPLGIVGGIAPWNYPLMMAVWKFSPALAAGNVQVLKPSEQTPLSLLRFAQIAQEILPAGRVQRRHRRRRAGRRGDREAPGRAARVADRRRRDRQGDRPDGRGHAQARPPRARRQGAGDRLRRRRPGRGRRGDQDRRLLELRPGLHGRLAGRGGPARSTTGCSRSSCPRSSRSRSATRPRARTSRWAR